MGLLRKILYPFTLLYGGITHTRNVLYDKGILKSTRFDIPVIVVGNLSVGGTGKTPMIEYLIRLLQEEYKIAVLSRGYKRKSRGFLLADASSTVSELGDEPMQYHTKFRNIHVAVDADRVHGIRKLLELPDAPEVLLLDDAYQHRKVQGGLNILLTPYHDLYVNDRVLPAGRLREKAEGAGRAQIIIITKCPEKLSEKEQFEIAKKLKVTVNQTAFFSGIDYSDDIIGNKDRIRLEQLQFYKVILITGIAQTEPLTTFLVKKNIRFEHLKYADHYNFVPADLQKIANKLSAITDEKKLILTTEKDYVRSFSGLDNYYYLPIETKFTDHREDFNRLIRNYVEKNTGNSRIH